MNFTNEQLSYIYLTLKNQADNLEKDIKVSEQKRNMMASMLNIVGVNEQIPEDKLAEMRDHAEGAIKEIVDACKHKESFIHKMLEFLSPIAQSVEEDDNEAYKVGLDFFNEQEFMDIQERYKKDGENFSD